MPIAAPFVRNLEGKMRLRVNNKPLPKDVRGFRNPVPPPKPSGSGILTKLLKFGGRLAAIPIMVLLDFFGNNEPLSDGTLPDWVKDVPEQQTLQAGILPFTGGQSNTTYYLRSYQLQPVGGGDGFPLARNPPNTIYTGFQQIQGPIARWVLFANNKYYTNIATYKAEGKVRYVSTAFMFFYNYAGALVHQVNLTNDWGIEPVGFVRADGQLDTGGNPPSTGEIKTSPDNKSPVPDANFNFTPFPSVEQGNKIPFPEFLKLPEITKKPTVVPTEVPQIIPDSFPEQIPAPDPDPKRLPIPFPLPAPLPLPKINPDPQPNFNPVPDPTPKPEKKWTRITTYLPRPIKTETKPPIILDQKPIPLPIPEPVKTPPPVQTPVDKCVDHCGGGTIDFDLLDDSDLAKLLAEIKRLLVKVHEYTVIDIDGLTPTTFLCADPDANPPQSETQKTLLNYTGKGITGLHELTKTFNDNLLTVFTEVCEKADPIAAIPEWWQVRAGSDRPQLVVIYKAGNSNWSMAIPWYKGIFKSTIIELIPSYTRGSFSTYLTLNDNSKVVVNAASKAEGEAVMNRIKAVISGSKLLGSELKSGGERKGKQIKSIKVKPAYAKYFARGQQDNLPNWRYNFKTKKYTKYDRADT
jgi:hypothetical protein